MKIGVFDSGVGGSSVVNAIQKALPTAQVLYATDKKHLPYGDKTPQQLLGWVTPILHKLIDEECEAIVVACNTVTTTIIGELRRQISVPLIGIEPMIKPAAMLTTSRIIVVCATPTTLASPRYTWLKQTYAKGIRVLEPDCSNWSYLIENQQIDRSHVHEQINSVCEAGADVIVLGCTHYHWIEAIVKNESRGRAAVLQPEQPVIAQLKRVLKLPKTAPKSPGSEKPIVQGPSLHVGFS